MRHSAGNVCQLYFLSQRTGVFTKCVLDSQNPISWRFYVQKVKITIVVLLLPYHLPHTLNIDSPESSICLSLFPGLSMCLSMSLSTSLSIWFLVHCLYPCYFTISISLGSYMRLKTIVLSFYFRISVSSGAELVTLHCILIFTLLCYSCCVSYFFLCVIHFQRAVLALLIIIVNMSSSAHVKFFISFSCR